MAVTTYSDVMSRMADEGFQIVSRRKAAKARRSMQGEHAIDVDEHIGADYVLAKLEDCRLELFRSDFCSTVKECFSRHGLVPFENSAGVDTSCGRIMNKRLVEELVGYGLGNFSTCSIARYQLGLFLILREFLEVAKNNCFIFDPRFRECEKNALVQLGLQLIDFNEVGKRRSKRKTLYYMPHCGNALYNNLLWANWELCALRNTIVVGNAFSSLAVRLPSSVMRKQFTCLDRILPYTTEIELRNCFEHRDVFNDTALHLFLNDPSCALPSEDFWLDANEPVNGDTEHGSEVIWTD